jgi:hypothetical protein
MDAKRLAILRFEARTQSTNRLARCESIESVRKLGICRPFVGKLTTAMEDWAISYPGDHLYYASRRASPALAVVVDTLRYRGGA